MLNNKNTATVFILIFIAINSFAQKINTTKRLQFHSINNVGLLEGQAGSAFQLQTINGAQYKSWFAGAGVGLDYYRYRTIPLFIDVRKQFGKRSNKLFVYADAGISFYWERDKDAKQFYYNDKFKNGFYWETGTGYKFKINQKLSLICSAGYSYKNITEEGSYNFYYTGGIGFLGPPVSSFLNKINYNLNRLVLKAGIEF
jgi:hypothetical protein